MKHLLLSLTLFVFTNQIFAQAPGVVTPGVVTPGVATPGALKLWYKKPAGNTWTDALPVGNGRLGAMVYGNPEKEVLKLNESTGWSQP